MHILLVTFFVWVSFSLNRLVKRLWELTLTKCKEIKIRPIALTTSFREYMKYKSGTCSCLKVQCQKKPIFLTACPWSHPYPFHWFKQCCAHPTEKYWDPEEYDYTEYCSGNSITYESLCCKDDDKIDCPYYNRTQRVGSRCAAPSREPTLKLP